MISPACCKCGVSDQNARRSVQGVEDRGERVAQLMGKHGQEFVLPPISLPQLLGLPPQFLLESLAVGEIAKRLDESSRLAVFGLQECHDSAPPEARSILPYVPPIITRSSRGQRLAELALGNTRRDVLQGEDEGRRPADGLGLGIAEQTCRSSVPGGHVPHGIHQKDGVVLNGLHPGVQQLLGFGHRASFRCEERGGCTARRAMRVPEREASS